MFIKTYYTNISFSGIISELKKELVLKSQFDRHQLVELSELNKRESPILSAQAFDCSDTYPFPEVQVWSDSTQTSQTMFGHFVPLSLIPYRPFRPITK